MELKKYRLGDIAEIIGGVSYSPKDICTGGIRILRGGNIQNQHIELKTDDVFLPISYKNNISQIYVGDTILVASTGSVDVLGKAATCFQYTEDVQIGAFLRIIRPKADKYTMLISSALSSDYFKRYIKAQAKGTSINNITLGYLRDFEIYAPHDFTGLSHLSANIENKICLNRAINDNLEAMAKQLYDYWFVQFDFPNEDGKPYKSSGGTMVWNEKLKREIPQGWSNGVLSDVANITMGQSPDGSSYNEDGEGIIFYQGSTDFGLRFPDIRQYTTSPSRYANKGDILMSVRAPVGALNIANNDCCIGRGLSALSSKIGSITHLYYLMNDFRLKFEGMNSAGTTFGSITKDELFSLPVIIPTKSVISEFEQVCEPIFDKQMIIGEEINGLTKQRDELLPLLMNGQATVNYHLSTQNCFKESTNSASISPIFSQNSA